MSRFKKLLILTAIIFLAVVIFFFARSQSSAISNQQQETLDLWGNPDQFVLSYLPQEGEKDEGSGQGNEENRQENLVRYEVWYYLEPAKQVSFLGGETLSIEAWAPEETVPQSTYVPWDFDFYTNFAELESMLGEQLHLIDLPGFSGEGLNTYVSSDLLVVLEDDYLTYMQTLAYDPTIEDDLLAEEEDLVVEEEDVAVEQRALEFAESGSETAVKQYTNSDLGFSIEYPSDWYLNSGVLSNYDTDYLISGEELPETIAKCDFVPYELTDVILGEMDLLYESALKIYRSQITNEVTDEDMGYGNNVVFYFEDDLHPPMLLICYAYDEELDSEILNILKTFKFLD
jgi:hypothetical protein